MNLGSQTRFWKHIWLGNQTLKSQYPNLYNIVRRHASASPSHHSNPRTTRGSGGVPPAHHLPSDGRRRRRTFSFGGQWRRRRRWPLTPTPPLPPPSSSSAPRCRGRLPCRLPPVRSPVLALAIGTYSDSAPPPPRIIPCLLLLALQKP